MAPQDHQLCMQAVFISESYSPVDQCREHSCLLEGLWWDLVLITTLQSFPQPPSQSTLHTIVSLLSVSNSLTHFLPHIISSTLKVEATRSSETSVYNKHTLAASQKTAFFIVSTVKTSNPTIINLKDFAPCD
jgi:hypothetical protein